MLKTRYFIDYTRNLRRKSAFYRLYSKPKAEIGILSIIVDNTAKTYQFGLLSQQKLLYRGVTSNQISNAKHRKALLHKDDQRFHLRGKLRENGQKSVIFSV